MFVHIKSTKLICFLVSLFSIDIIRILPIRFAKNEIISPINGTSKPNELRGSNGTRPEIDPTKFSYISGLITLLQTCLLDCNQGKFDLKLLYERVREKEDKHS